MQAPPLKRARRLQWRARDGRKGEELCRPGKGKKLLGGLKLKNPDPRGAKGRGGQGLRGG